MRFSADDCHPDAHAVRCHLALLCFHACRSAASTTVSGSTRTSIALVSKSLVTNRAILPGPSGYGIAGIGSGDLSNVASVAFRSLVDWDVCDDYTQYLKKLSHVSPEVCYIRPYNLFLLASLCLAILSHIAHNFIADCTSPTR